MPARLTGTGGSAPGSMLGAALEIAAHGWPVLPVHCPRNGGCSCGDSGCKRIGKHPRTLHGVKDASIDPKQIRSWWTSWPDANIGIATGPPSGLLVLDVDGAVGRKSLTDLIKEYGLPKTRFSFTGRTGKDGKQNGAHLLFKYPVGVTIGKADPEAYC